MTPRPHLPTNGLRDAHAFPSRIGRDSVAALVSVAFVALVPLLVLLAGLVLPGGDGGVLGSSGTLLRQAAGDGIVLLVLAVLVTILTGWRSVLQDPARTRSRWGIGALAAFTVVTLVAFSTPVKPGVGNYLLALLVTVVAVALVEELVYRGVVVAGLRRVAPEWVVWLVSTAAFALAHAFNTSGGGLFQVVMTFFLGSACYLSRRITGSVLGAVVVHMLYNAFVGFRTQTLHGVPFVLSAASTLALILAAVIGFLVARRRSAQ